MIHLSRLCRSSAGKEIALVPLAAAGGLLVADANVQLHELDEVQANVLRERFLASGAGVLLARGQQPQNEIGLQKAARAVGLGRFIRTAKGHVQHYVAIGRRGTQEADHPRGSDFWHQDNSYLRKPARFTGLYATDEIPADEGDTDFAHLGKAWQELDESTREIALGLHAWHCHAHNAGFPHPQYTDGPRLQPERHPIVSVHPVTGREALFLSPCYLRELDVKPEANREHAVQLLKELTAHAVRSEFVFSHRWSPGDLLFWDNQIVMHRANTINMSRDSKRVMFRMSFNDS